MAVKKIEINKNPALLFLNFWAPVFLYAYLIFFVSSMPYLQAPLKFPYADKFLHIGEYLVLGLLFKRALQKTFLAISGFRVYILVLLFIFVYGASDEIHQFFVPGRSCSGFDLLADVVGGFLGGGLIYKWQK